MNFGSLVHLPAIQKTTGCEVTAICDGGSGSSYKLKKLKGLKCQIFDNYLDLIKSKDVDIVSIAAPTYLHSEILRNCLRLKKNVICEKPFGLSFQDIRGIARKMHNQNLINIVNYEFRYEFLMNELKKLIKKKSLGDILKLKVDWRIKSANKRNTWKEKISMGGGVVNELLCHVLDYINFLLSKKIDYSQSIKRKKIKKNFLQINFLKKNTIIEINIVKSTSIQQSSHNIEVEGKLGKATLKYFMPFCSKSKQLLISNNKNKKIVKIKDDNLFFSDDRILSFHNLLSSELKKKLNIFSTNFLYSEYLRKQLDSILR